MENVRRFADMGGFLVPGTDAGAWNVFQGSLSEYELLEEALGEHSERILARGIEKLKEKF